MQMSRRCVKEGDARIVMKGQVMLVRRNNKDCQSDPVTMVKQVSLNDAPKTLETSKAFDGPVGYCLASSQHSKSYKHCTDTRAGLSPPHKWRRKRPCGTTNRFHTLTLFVTRPLSGRLPSSNDIFPV